MDVPNLDPEVARELLDCQQHGCVTGLDQYSWWPKLHQIGLLLLHLLQCLMWPLVGVPMHLTLLSAVAGCDCVSMLPILCSTVERNVDHRLAGWYLEYWTSAGHKRVYASSMNDLSNTEFAP